MMPNAKTKMRFHIRKTNDVRVATVFETDCKALLVIEPSPDINLHIFAVKVKSFKLQAQKAFKKFPASNETRRQCIKVVQALKS